jgi:hypothetical protein
MCQRVDAITALVEHMGGRPWYLENREESMPFGQTTRWAAGWDALLLSSTISATD